MTMKERIQKVLAAAGVASRRAVEEMVRQGRIEVNGQTVIELPILIDPEHDRVTVDDEPVRLGTPKTEKRYYILMNKPKGVYTTNVAQGEQLRAIDLLPATFPARVYPVGRLDSESTGLLLLTNDGELTNQLTHPRFGVSKTYRAVVDGYVQPQTMQAMEKGIWLADRSGKTARSGRARIRIESRDHHRSILEITLNEGRNPQVRRMMAALGHKVRELTRIRFGLLTIKGLAIGQYRDLTPYEIKQLRHNAQPKPNPPKGS